MAVKAWHDLTHAHLCSLFSARPSHSPWALIRPNSLQSSNLFFQGPPYVFSPANIPFRWNASPNLQFFVCLVNSYSSFNTQTRHPDPVMPLLSSFGSHTVSPAAAGRFTPCFQGLPKPLPHPNTPPGNCSFACLSLNCVLLQGRIASYLTVSPGPSTMSGIWEALDRCLLNESVSE